MGTMGVGIEDYPWRLNDIGGAYPWVVPGWWGGAVATLITANRLYYTPIFVNERRTYDRIGVSVWIGGGAGTVARLGIYEWADGLPGALILDAGTVPIIALGIQTIVINQTLERGYYFLAMVGDGGAQMFGIQTTNAVMPPVQGMGAIASVGAVNMILYRDAVGVGALADPAPVPTAARGVADEYVFLRGT